jgi:hypothetical protein
MTEMDRFASVAAPPAEWPLAPTGRTATLEQAVLLGSELPELLMSALERRYLNEFQPTAWRIGNVADDGSRPLLREVTGMGRQRPGEDWSQAMPHVLTATYAQRQALVLALQGDVDRHRIFVGGRRLSGPAQGSTEDFIDGQASVLQAHVPGLTMGPAARLDSEPMAGLSEFLRSAPALAVVTGVPSARSNAGSAVFQNIDRLVAAAGPRRYALLVIAEPLEPADLDRTIDHCRMLRTEVHGLVSRTISSTEGSSATESMNRPVEPAHGRKVEMILPTALYGLAMFCGVAGLVPGIGPLASLATPAMLAASVSRQAGQSRRGSTTTGNTETRSAGETVELLNANAEACETLLRHHIDRLEAARSNGWWRTSVFVAAESDSALEAVTGALRGIASGTTSALDPLRVVRPAPHLVRTATVRGQSLSLVPSGGNVGHPFGAAFDSLATCMTSDELSVLVTLPRRDIPGLPRHEVGDFALSAPRTTDDSVHLGHLMDGSGRSLASVGLTAESLNRHVLIAGMTGYGKTTTAQRLLLETHTGLGLPFTVIEPVKAEYRRLAGHPDLGGRLRVYTIGAERRGGGHPLRLNPFVPGDNVPLLRHIDLLKAVFNASFPMFAGMSYVLEEAMLAIYTERGWDLHTSANDLLGPDPAADDVVALVPSIADLHDKVEQVLSDRQYGREVHQNMGAALRSRLRSLMVGAKGMTLNARRSVTARELFGEPCVIELRNLGDDEEKAFVMALLLCQLYEFAEARREDDPYGADGLRHVTLIEEAHRLLRAPRSAGSPESADSQAKAVAMFTDMLAEMRAYGEGFVVADQIPTKLAPEILKNSNVKILHRLVAPDDRAVVAAAVNLDDGQSRHLATLHPGTAVVHDDRIGSAVLVRIAPLPTGDASVEHAARPADLSYLHRNSACRHCAAPCTLLDPVRRAASDATVDEDLAGLWQHVLLGNADRAWRTWRDWRSAWQAHATESAGAPEGTYCAASQSGHRWVDRLATARSVVAGRSGFDGARALVVQRCARQVAGLLRSWLAAAELGPRERTRFDTAHRALATQLTEQPPAELPGCVRCPARCRMLPAVAPVLAAAGPAVATRATASTPPQTRLRAVAGITDGGLRAALEAQPGEAERRTFLYCLVTTATGEHAPQDLLAELRD